MKSEMMKKLEQVAFERTKPFCYGCYRQAPTGVCLSCGSDDLMRELPGVGVEYGLNWVIVHILDTKVLHGSDFDLPPELPSVPVSKSNVDYLLTKPSNKEQERVIKKLEETGAVLVQGPPGTGKSHTIANILGHLLANGKRVLVSSHTSKALRVVREQVVEELRPLCISVLDNDHESKGQLEDSVNKIVNYHSKTDEKTLELEADQLNGQRKKLKEKLQLLNDLALVIRRSEYEDIVLCGESLNPSESARYVKENSVCYR